MTPSNNNPNAPHTVKVFSSGRVQCDKDCPNYRAYFICAHTIAVAEENGSLQSFVKWHRKEKRGTNLTALANVGMPVSAGKKSTTSTKRRRGSTNSSRKTAQDVGVTSRFPSTSAIHPKPARPALAFGTFAVGNLKFLDGKVSVCYGCRRTLKPQGQIPPEPEDLVIVSVARRSYMKDGKLVTSSEYTNVYYHLNPNCVAEKNAFFLPGLVKIPDDLKPFLKQSHIRAIREKLSIHVD